MIGSTLTFIEKKRRHQATESEIYSLYFKANYAIRNNLPEAQALKTQFSAYKYRFGDLWRYLETTEYLYGKQHTQSQELAA